MGLASGVLGFSVSDIVLEGFGQAKGLWIEAAVLRYVRLGCKFSWFSM